MSENGFFDSFEHLGHSLLDIAIGIGAVALGLRFFKNSLKSSEENKKARR